MHIYFKKGEWESYFQYAYNERFPIQPIFNQEEDCIANRRNAQMADGFEYTTIFTKEKYKTGARINFVCSFESYGAPLITLTDRLKRHENGILSYGTCHEVVIWENGINVFYLFETKNEIKWNQLLADSFSLEPGKKHRLSLEIVDKYIRVALGERSFELRIENLPEEFYIGLTGCENINRLYSVEISKCDD